MLAERKIGGPGKTFLANECGSELLLLIRACLLSFALG